MLIPTLTEDEVKIALGEMKVQFFLCYIPKQSTDLYHFKHEYSLIFNFSSLLHGHKSFSRKRTWKSRRRQCHLSQHMLTRLLRTNIPQHNRFQQADSPPTPTPLPWNSTTRFPDFSLPRSMRQGQRRLKHPQRGSGRMSSTLLRTKQLSPSR